MFKSLTFEVVGERRLACAGCEERVEELLEAVDGVRQVRARARDQRVEVLFDARILDARAIEERLRSAGYEARAGETAAPPASAVDSRMAIDAFRSGMHPPAAPHPAVTPSGPPARGIRRTGRLARSLEGMGSNGIPSGGRMELEARSRGAGTRRTLTAASFGGAIVAAFASALCCLGPLLFAVLGLGGAGLLVKLEAYRPYFAAVTLLLLGAGFYLTYRRPRLAPASASAGPACECALPRANRFGRVMLWIATAVVAGFLAFPYLARLIFD